MAKTKKLTKKQQAEYIKNSNTCPYCGSEALDGDYFEQEDNFGWRDVVCNACKRRWQDLFTLTGIAEEE